MTLKGMLNICTVLDSQLESKGVMTQNRAIGPNGKELICHFHQHFSTSRTSV